MIDDTNQFYISLCFAVLVGLTGCSAGTFAETTPQKEPAPVKIANNATLTEEFEVYVMDVGDNISITWDYNQSSNLTGNISIPQGSMTYHKGGLINLDLPDSATRVGRYTLEPGQNETLSVESVSPDEAIVIVIYDEPEGTYRAIKSLSCGGAIVGYKVVTKSGGSDDWTPGVHQCKPDFPF